MSHQKDCYRRIRAVSCFLGVFFGPGVLSVFKRPAALCERLRPVDCPTAVCLVGGLKSFAAELKVLCCFSKEVLVRNWLEIASVADHRGMIHQRVRGRNLCLLQRGRKFRFVFHLINLLHKD